MASEGKITARLDIKNSTVELEEKYASGQLVQKLENNMQEIVNISQQVKGMGEQLSLEPGVIMSALRDVGIQEDFMMPQEFM